MKLKFSQIMLTALLLASGLMAQSAAHSGKEPRTKIPQQAPKGYELVKYAIDGDTIELADGRMVRYLGMDTPETVDPRKSVQCFGHEASEYNRALVQGKFVRLVKDIEDTDKYDRLLRYIYLEDGTFVNLKLVTNGYARVYTWPPNIAHTKEFISAQADARSASRGLWSACPVKK